MHNVGFCLILGLRLKIKDVKSDMESQKEPTEFVAGRFLAKHISTLPIKNPLNLNGRGGCCYSLLLHRLVDSKASQ